MKTTEELEDLGPCIEGLEWCRKQASLYEAWEVCEKSQWMWWFLRKTGVSKEISVKYARECVKHISRADVNPDYVNHVINVCDHYAIYASTRAAVAADHAGVTANYAVVAVCYHYDNYDTAAASAERKWQANLIRTLVPNPFEK